MARRNQTRKAIELSFEAQTLSGSSPCCELMYMCAYTHRDLSLYIYICTTRICMSTLYELHVHTYTYDPKVHRVSIAQELP